MKIAKLLLVLFCCILVFTGGCKKTGEGKPEKTNKVILRLPSVLPPDHPTSKALEYFKNKIAEISEGKIEVRLYMSSQLGSEIEAIEMCQAGNIEMLFISVAPLTQYVPELNIFVMPFIFRDPQHCYNVVDSNIGEYFSSKLEKLNFETLCFLDSGSRNIMTKKGPITKPGDLKGMKIRVMGAPLMIDVINAMGAAAIPMNQGEVYAALQTGVIDGWENNPPTALTFKMYETGCIYYARTQHLIIPDLLLINKTFYEKLDKQTRDYIDLAAKQTMAEQRRMWQESEKETVEVLKKAGMKFNDVDKTLFVEQIKSVYDEYYKKYGDEFKGICEKIKAMK